MARSGGHMILASSALSILVFAALVQYYVHTQFPVHRPGSKVIDFLSYLLSFVTLPVIRQFFTINEAYWDSDHELQGIKTGVDVYRDDHGIPYVFGHNADDVGYVQAFIEYTVVLQESADARKPFDVSWSELFHNHSQNDPSNSSF